MNRKTTLGLWLLVVVLIGLPVSSGLIHLLTESWWFEAVNFSDIFWKSLFWEGLLGGIVFTLFIAVLGLNYLISQALTRDRNYQIFQYTELQSYSDLIVKSIAVFLIGFIALIAASNSASSWVSVLQFIHSQSFNKTDPIFAQDIGFYIFRLPFWDGLRQVLLMLSVWGLAITGTIYSLKGVFLSKTKGVSRPIRIHLTIVCSAIVLLIGWGFWLNRFHLINESSGVVFGIGYTDANARIFGLNLMAIATLILTLFLLISIVRWRPKGLMTAASIFILSWMVLLGIYPWFIQQFVVRPNELVKEKPYLENNIQNTQAAYQLDNIQTQDFNVQANLTRADLSKNAATLNNVRLWDYRPLLQTYRQLQEIRSYYRFHDVDVDRYQLKDGLQQVMLSARELESNQLPAQAKNWVNQQLKYTHGHGLVMSPVNRVTKDGLPDFFIQDIPPKSKVGLDITEPGIYYGELTNSYIFTGTETDEFDYPEGGSNAFTRYSGQGGVAISNPIRKLAYALDLQNFQILISNYFKDTTKIHYHRAVLDRVQHIAPFLKYDQDPYLVLDEGKPTWVIDAYTVSDQYPYSEPSPLGLRDRQITEQGFSFNRSQINYIRNSVKVLVNAYNGDVKFVVVDPNDPIIKTFQAIFPSIFTSQDRIKPEIQSHFRYPEDLFQIQTSQYLTYHMSNPEVYYNREDLWQLPRQVYENQEVLVEPYYIIMRLPEQEKTEFILIQPFTPSKKDNMISWMAARSDGENYGSLIQYSFPKQSLIFGPRQIEARIDQDPTISEQLTLWSQSGSKVIRGNLIILPLEDSLLYIEPIYLRAEQAALPELKRVVVAYDKSVVMAKTFDDALNQIFRQSPVPQSTIQTNDTNDDEKTIETLAQEALQTHQNAETAIKNGDWSKFGELQKRLKNILQKMNK